MPLIPPWGGNLYIDPAMFLADPELRFDDIEFEPRLFFDEPALWATASKILHLVEEDDDDRLYAETLTAQLAIELVRFRSRGALRPFAEHGGLAEWQRRAVIEFINDNLDRNISLKELASLVRLSPNHLCKAFARTMGMPPHQYHRRPAYRARQAAPCRCPPVDHRYRLGDGLYGFEQFRDGISPGDRPQSQRVSAQPDLTARQRRARAEVGLRGSRQPGCGGQDLAAK